MATITDPTAYIRDVSRALGRGAVSDYWTWEGPAPEDIIEEIELSEAGVAAETALAHTESGRQGMIALADGALLTWHENTGWEHWDESGDGGHLPVAVDAAPDQVAAHAP